MRALAVAAIGLCACARRPESCVPIPGLAPLLAPGALLVFGEVHGTREIPAFVGEVACAAARAGRVRVGLELPASDAPLLRRFLDGDEGALGHSEPWRRPALGSGRTSAAMLALLQRLRALRRAGAPVEPFFFDEMDAGPKRDEQMAANISAERKKSDSDIHL